MISTAGQKSQSLIEQIKKHENPPKNLKKIFNSDELRFIEKVRIDCYNDTKNCQEKLTQSGREPLGLVAHPQKDSFEQLEKLLREKLKSEMDEPYELQMSFHRNDFPYGTHTDSGYDEKELIYKQGIIPLSVFPENSQVYTLIFNQKCYHSISYPSDLETLRTLTEKEKSQIEGLDPELSPTDQQLESYWGGTSQDRERLKGLSLALPFEWTLGDMAIWDRAHLHCSSDFKSHGIQRKIGLMWISKKI